MSEMLDFWKNVLDKNEEQKIKEKTGNRLIKKRN